MEEKDLLWKLRHTASHVLAMAVIEFDPKVKLAIGPPIDDGFYYDFQFSKPIGENDLAGLEKSMRKIIAQDLLVENRQLARAEAIKKEGQADQPFKSELIEDLPDKELSYYGIGDFWDLCKGPHISSTGGIKAVKLLRLAGAYWRGDEKRPMLTRIYGTAWTSQKELDDHLRRLEEAKQHDHRKLGRELGIFAIIPEIGSGLPVWLPRGATVYRLLEGYLTKLELDGGYQHVITNPLGRKELYQLSGHLDHYQESMYPVIELDNQEFVLRPMNCPHHISIFQQGSHSYRDLPIRLAEFGQVFRLEKSGELSGLQRVRSFTINDSHIFCREDQIKAEIKAIVALIQQVYKRLGLTDYWFRFSLRGEQNEIKYADNALLWDKSETLLRQSLIELKVKFIEAPDEAAFYGPKLDVQMKNILGKEETVSTVQLDFYLPERFGLEYVAEDGSRGRPVIIHRAVLGSMERFIGIYLEKIGGELPVWLAPVQAAVLPVGERFDKYALEVANQLRLAGIRVECLPADSTLGKRIRTAELSKVPYILVVGEREEQQTTVTVRDRRSPEQRSLTVEQAVALISEDQS